MFFASDSANFEGIYYLRLGENLAAGRGYLGLRENGLQLLYSPLFPGLIALGTLAFGHAELVVRLVNVVLGAGLTIPIFLIARPAAGTRIAALAALLAAIHPYLIAMSTIILADSLYMLLLLSGIYLVLTAAETAPFRRASFAGVCFGLAYLARPEGLIFAVVGAAILILAYRPRWRLGFGLATALVLCALLIAAPYIGWLTASAGQFLLEGKSTDALKTQYLAKVPPAEIFFGITDNLEPTGLSMMSNREAIQKFKVRPWAAAVFALSTAPHSLRQIGKNVATTRALSNPLLAGLAFLGLLRGLRRREAWLYHATLGTIVVTTSTALLMVADELFPERYLSPFLPPLLIWAAAGIALLWSWTEKGCVSIAHLPTYAGRLMSGTIAGLLVLTLTLLPIAALRDASDLQQSWGDSHIEKEIGLRLKSRSGIAHPRVMATKPTTAYYAGGSLVSFPAGAGSRALRFIDAEHVDFIILPSQPDGGRPYLREWIEHGIPDAHAAIVRRIPNPTGGELVVYRWTP